VLLPAAVIIYSNKNSKFMLPVKLNNRLWLSTKLVWRSAHQTNMLSPRHNGMLGIIVVTKGSTLLVLLYFFKQYPFVNVRSMRCSSHAQLKKKMAA
jgi:hypothetical protein